jgi:hypothetical protein
MKHRAQALAIFAFLSTVCTAATVEEAIALGRKALQTSATSTAWKIAQTLLLEVPDSAPAHEFAGEVLFRRGEIPKAEDEFKRALKLRADFGRAWWGLAKIAECSSMYETADRYFRRAHDQAPADPQVFRDWASRLEGQEHIDGLVKYQAMLDPARDQEEIEAIRQHVQFDKALKGRKLSVLASPYQQTEMPLAFINDAGSHTRAYGLEVIINGVQLTLVLDTGATGILISQRAASRADMEKIAPASYGGIGDNVKLAGGYRGIATRLVAGGVEFHDALVNVTEKDVVPYADGLIGSDLFSMFLVELDFPGRKFRLTPFPGYDPAAPPHDRSEPPPGFVPIFRFGHMLLIPASVNDNPGNLFLMDSGAQRSMISYDLAARLSRLTPDDATRLSGVRGHVADAYKTEDVFLEFAGFRQKNIGMTAFDMREQSRRMGVELSGFLGLPLLDLFRLTIDYHNGFAKFDFPSR